VWRRRLFEWEKVLLLELLEEINTVNLRRGEVDNWGCKPENGADFTVKSTYKIVAKLTEPDNLVTPWQAFIFKMIWKCPTPSKVSGFIWQLLHGRIPTRNNLISRHVLNPDGDTTCVICGEAEETELHLFLYCEIAMLVWLKILHWLDILLSSSQHVLPSSLFHGGW
jgi:hypothetical protein